MGDIKHLINRAAVAKIKKIAEHEVAMLCTFVPTQTPRARPMSTLSVDEAGTLWFFSARGSPKNQEIAANPQVQLIYALPSKSAYLTLSGTATISRDQAKIDTLWNPLAKAWFSDGPTDPALTVISIVPSDGYYWDTKHNKMVQMVQLAVGALTGKPFDGGVEGTLST